MNEKSGILVQIWQKSSVGLGKGLPRNTRQAINCTNADPVQWHMYAAIGGDELRDAWTESIQTLMYIQLNIAVDKISKGNTNTLVFLVPDYIK